jgi:uncharacterized repeat protein (TIGR02543 family)
MTDKKKNVSHKDSKDIKKKDIDLDEEFEDIDDIEDFEDLDDIEDIEDIEDFDDLDDIEDIEDIEDVEEKPKSKKEEKETPKEDKQSDKPKKEEKEKDKDNKKTENKEEKNDNNKSENKKVVGNKVIISNNKKDEEDDEDEDEEKSPLLKILAAIVVVVIIILLLLKGCKANEFTVKFNTDGGTSISEVKVKDGDTLARPSTPTKDGYTFAGWYQDASYTQEFDFSTKVDKDFTLYAKWEKKADAKVSGVRLDQTDLTLKPGASTTVVATVEPEDAANKNVTWKSSDDSIVTVDENGNITAVKEGTATVTVTTEDGEHTATVKVTVSNDTVAVTGVNAPANIEVSTKGSKNIGATVTPANASNKGLEYKSADPKIATVNANGTVTGVKEGTTTITVTSKDGGKTATVKVTVKDVKVTGVTLTPKAATVTTGKTTKLTATVQPANASNKDVTWKSSDESVATVNNGTVTAKKAGTVTITVTTKDGNKTATSTITVKDPVHATAVTINGASEVQVGKTINLTATITPKGAVETSVTWSVAANSGTATINAKTGALKGTKAGTVTVTAKTANGVTATKVITVKEAPASYAVTFTANYTGSTISSWSFAVTKNNNSFNDYTRITCGGAVVRKAAGTAPGDFPSTAKQCTVRLTDGTDVTATATFKK